MKPRLPPVRIVSSIFISCLILTCAVNISKKSYCELRGRCRGRTDQGAFENDITEFDKRNCFCDPSCEDFGDCCKDYLARSSGRHSDYTCKDFGSHFGSYYVKTSCLHNFPDQEIVNQCLDISDPLSQVPVTNVKTHVTYANIFCAVCNNETQKHLRTWNYFMYCKQNDHLLINQKMLDFNWHYNGTMDQFYFKVPQGGFVCSQVTFVPPNEFKGIPMRKCKEAIAACPKNWPNKTEVRMCKSYTDYRYYQKLVYKNEYCAKCNNVTRNKLKCIQKTNDLWLAFPHAAYDWPNYMNIECFLSSTDLNDTDDRTKLASSYCAKAGLCFSDNKRTCYKCATARIDSFTTMRNGLMEGLECSAQVMLKLDARFQTGGHIMNIRKRCRKGRVYDPFKKICRYIIRTQNVNLTKEY